MPESTPTNDINNTSASPVKWPDFNWSLSSWKPSLDNNPVDNTSTTKGFIPTSIATPNWRRAECDRNFVRNDRNGISIFGTPSADTVKKYTSFAEQRIAGLEDADRLALGPRGLDELRRRILMGYQIVRPAPWWHKRKKDDLLPEDNVAGTGAIEALLKCEHASSLFELERSDWEVGATTKENYRRTYNKYWLPIAVHLRKQFMLTDVELVSKVANSIKNSALKNRYQVWCRLHRFTQFLHNSYFEENLPSDIEEVFSAVSRTLSSLEGQREEERGVELEQLLSISKMLTKVHREPGGVKEMKAFHKKFKRDDSFRREMIIINRILQQSLSYHYSTQDIISDSLLTPSEVAESNSNSSSISDLSDSSSLSFHPDSMSCKFYYMGEMVFPTRKDITLICYFKGLVFAWLSALRPGEWNNTKRATLPSLAISAQGTAIKTQTVSALIRESKKAPRPQKLEFECVCSNFATGRKLGASEFIQACRICPVHCVSNSGWKRISSLSYATRNKMFHFLGEITGVIDKSIPPVLSQHLIRIGRVMNLAHEGSMYIPPSSSTSSSSPNSQPTSEGSIVRVAGDSLEILRCNGRWSLDESAKHYQKCSRLHPSYVKLSSSAIKSSVIVQNIDICNLLEALETVSLQIRSCEDWIENDDDEKGLKKFQEYRKNKTDV